MLTLILFDHEQLKLGIQQGLNFLRSLIFFRPRAMAPEDTTKTSLSFFNNQAMSSLIEARILWLT